MAKLRAFTLLLALQLSLLLPWPASAAALSEVHRLYASPQEATAVIYDRRVNSIIDRYGNYSSTDDQLYFDWLYIIMYGDGVEDGKAIYGDDAKRDMFSHAVKVFRDASNIAMSNDDQLRTLLQYNNITYPSEFFYGNDDQSPMPDYVLENTQSPSFQTGSTGIEAEQISTTQGMLALAVGAYRYAFEREASRGDAEFKSALQSMTGDAIDDSQTIRNALEVEKDDDVKITRVSELASRIFEIYINFAIGHEDGHFFLNHERAGTSDECSAILRAAEMDADLFSISIIVARLTPLEVRRVSTGKPTFVPSVAVELDSFFRYAYPYLGGGGGCNYLSPARRAAFVHRQFQNLVRVRWEAFQRISLVWEKYPPAAIWYSPAKPSNVALGRLAAKSIAQCRGIDLKFNFGWEIVRFEVGHRDNVGMVAIGCGRGYSSIVKFISHADMLLIGSNQANLLRSIYDVGLFDVRESQGGRSIQVVGLGRVLMQNLHGRLEVIQNCSNDGALYLRRVPSRSGWFTACPGVFDVENAVISRPVNSSH